MSKLTDYSAVTRLTSSNIFIVDGSGTKKITAGNAAAELAGLVSVTEHRNTFRGKNLGTSVSSTQKTAISNGTFDDLFIGDYWSINSVNWTIADMDYFYNTGDASLTKHHLVMVPASNLTSAPMNDTNDTTGGYVNSKMRTETLVGEDVKGKIEVAFPNMLIKHKEYLVNAVQDGHASGGAWFDAEVELMNEIMVYGCHILTPMSTGTVAAYGYTVAKQQLALFALNPKSVNIRAWYWLRDVRSASTFCRVTNPGDANAGSASVSGGVRPYFLIGVA